MHEVLRVGRLWDGREPQELSGASCPAPFFFNFAATQNLVGV